MLTHNAWHLALFEFESGDIDAATEIFDEWLLPHADDSLPDAADATALLWRLQQRGVRAGARWQFLSDGWNAALDTAGFWPYLDLHALLAFRAAGHTHRAQHLLLRVAHCAQGTNEIARRARELARPALGAMAAIIDGDASIARQPECAPDCLRALGGSGPQLHIIERMLCAPVDA